MNTFNIPTKEEVSEGNKAIFNTLESKLGFIPNLYASYAHSSTALGDYLNLQSRKTSLSAKEKEIINLVVSQSNNCGYCLAAHTAIGKMNGFNNEQILEIREGSASWNEKFDALAKFVKSASTNKSQASAESIENFYNSGYTKENLIDTLMVIGDKTISNYLYANTHIPVDFPAAPELEYAS